MDEAAFVAEGLYDPQAPGAEDRLALLDYLRARGATIEDLRDAPDLAALAGELARRGSDARLTPLQAAERTGVDIEIIERVVRSGGLATFDRARVYEAASGLLTGQVPLIIELLFSLHIETAARRSIDARTDDTRTATFAVGFVDLVASTAMRSCS